MTLQERISKVKALFSSDVEVSFNGKNFMLPLAEIQLVQRLSIPHEEFGDELILKLEEYFTEVHLIHNDTLQFEVNLENYNSHLLLVNVHGTIIEFSLNKGFTIHSKGNEETYIKFSNAISYYDLFSFLITPPFSDYFNDSNEEIIIYNEANGIIRIKYDSIPELPFLNIIAKEVENIKANAAPVEVSPYVKNAIFKKSNGTGIIHIDEIIKSASEIVYSDKRDYELVSKKFDFDKFRDSIYKEKDKYFTGIREIINKIFALAVGIPISISASVFATYKVSDNNIVLALVLLAFLLYVSFYIRIQFVYKKDLEEIKEDFAKSFGIIKLKSGLDEATIEHERIKIARKFKTTSEIIVWLVSLVAFLCLLVVIYIVSQIFFNETLSFLKLFWRRELQSH